MPWPNTVDTFRTLTDYDGSGDPLISDIPTAADFAAIFAAIQHAQSPNLGPTRLNVNAPPYNAPGAGQDNAPAFQHALNDAGAIGSANGRGEVEIAPGSYPFATPLAIPAGVSLRMRGALLQYNGGAASAAMTTASGQNNALISIEGGRLDCGGAGVNGLDLHNIQNCSIRGLFIANSPGYAYRLLGDNFSGAGNVAFNVFDFNGSNACYGGLYIEGSGPTPFIDVTATWITNCYFLQCASFGIHVRQWADTLHFFAPYVNLCANGGIGLALSTNGPGELNVNTYTFDGGVTVDAITPAGGTPTGCTAVQLGQITWMINLGDLATSPGPFAAAGTLINDLNGTAVYRVRAVTEVPAYVIDKTPLQRFKGNGSAEVRLGDPSIGNYAGLSLNGTLDTTHYNLLSGQADPNLYINRPAGQAIQFREGHGTVQAILAPGGILSTTGRAQAATAVNTNYTVATTDEDLFTTGGAGGITVTLPAATAAGGRVITVKKIDSAAGTVKVISAGGTIDGVAAATGITITNQYSVLTVQSNGTNWFILNRLGT